MTTKTITVCPWQEQWRTQFAQLSDLLSKQLHGLISAIEHVGSTSVVGLCAKPILDVDVVIPDMTFFDAVKTRLAEIGYHHRGELGVKGREAFGYQNNPDLMRHNLYVLTENSEELKRHLGFRDWLRSHPEDRDAYGKVKLEAAERFPENIDAYIDMKSDFIMLIYHKAGLTDANDLFANAWSALINRYGLPITDLECRELEAGLHGCVVTTEQQTRYLLVWEKAGNWFLNLPGLGEILPTKEYLIQPTASGKAFCELPKFGMMLFESEKQAMMFCTRHEEINNG